MKWFIAGATGYTGTALVKAAAAKGIEVIAHRRPDSSSDPGPLRAAGATLAQTPWEPQAIAEAMVGCDVVFCLLGTTAAKARKASARGEDASYEYVDRDLPLLLLGAAQAQPTPPTYVYLSSSGADAAVRNRYLQARFDVEAALTASGLSYVIARPGFITGPDRPERRFLERAGAAIIDGLLRLLKGLGWSGPYATFRSISGAQLARALMESLKGPLPATYEARDLLRLGELGLDHR